MFNPKRFAAYFSRMFVVLIPILALVFALSILTEFQAREGPAADWILSWQFWLAVARDLLPSIVALLAGLVLAAGFVQALYKLESRAEAQSLVMRLLFGLRSFGPWVRVAGGVAEGDSKDVVLNVGGPGNLVIYGDSAVLLQCSGRFTRVESSGFAKLEPFERIYTAIDLRPKREVYSVEAISKEGIPIRCQAEIGFQVDCGGQTPTPDVPFPAPKDTIFRAGTCSWIREADRPAENRTMDWVGRVLISETEGNLRTILARYPLDRLIGLTGGDGDDTREQVRRQLEARLRAEVPKLGARILAVELGDIQVQDEITQQWIGAWQARWASWVAERQATGRARQIEQIEDAKTRAQIMMIEAITGAFRPLDKQTQALSSRLVLTRLFMVLGRASTEPLTRIFLPPEAMNTLKQLQNYVEDTPPPAQNAAP